MENRELTFLGVNVYNDLKNMIENHNIEPKNLNEHEHEIYNKAKDFIFNNLGLLLQNYQEQDEFSNNFKVIVNEKAHECELFYDDLFKIADERGDDILETVQDTKPNIILKEMIRMMDENASNSELYCYCLEKLDSDEL